MSRFPPSTVTFTAPGASGREKKEITPPIAPFPYKFEVPPLHDLDAVEHAFRHASPVDPLAPRVVDRKAVEEHDGAPLVDATNGDDLRRSADETARAGKLDAGNLAQEVLRLARGARHDLMRREHVDRPGDDVRLGRHAGGRRDDARQHQ